MIPKFQPMCQISGLQLTKSLSGTLQAIFCFSIWLITSLFTSASAQQLTHHAHRPFQPFNYHHFRPFTLPSPAPSLNNYRNINCLPQHRFSTNINIERGPASERTKNKVKVEPVHRPTHRSTGTCTLERRVSELCECLS